MKLIVPFIGGLRPADTRLIRLAEFLGVEAQPLSLERPVRSYGEFFEKAVNDRQSCLVANAEVFREWLEAGEIPTELITFLQSHFRRLLVYGLDLDPFSQALVRALSNGEIREVRTIERADAGYEIAAGSADVCEAFAGLSFGPADPSNDRVMSTAGGGSRIRSLIQVGGLVLMASMRQAETEVFFLAGKDVADLDAEVGETPVEAYFSRLMPYAMALRHIFAEQCWLPAKPHASVIIDDPWLKKNYGFLNFEQLLKLVKQHNFHATIAFIPHNCRRSSPRIARMFRENRDRLALCFHGNDHTGAEFAANDTALLNAMVSMAEKRMDVHRQITGIDCDRVMVFPQGNFSVEAMSVLRAHNFDAAVNTTPHPRQQVVHLTLREIAQPAVLRYARFPLFLRKDSEHTQNADIAFNLFFGRPVVIVEHHQIFQHPEELIDAVARINKIAPNIRWSSPGAAVNNAILRRRTGDNRYQVCAFSRSVEISNPSEARVHYSVEWSHATEDAHVEGVQRDGNPCADFKVDENGTHASFDLGPKSSASLAMVHQNLHPQTNLGFRRTVRAVVRRRLSEIRDNYLSKNPSVLNAAKSLQRAVLK